MPGKGQTKEAEINAAVEENYKKRIIELLESIDNTQREILRVVKEEVKKQ